MSTEPGTEVPRVSAEDLERLRQTPGVMVIDIRPAFDYAGGRVPGSLNLPGAAVQGQVGQIPSAARLVFVCDDGRRSAEIATVAKASGFSDVSLLEGGYDGWLEAELDVETISDGVMPGPPPRPAAPEK